MVGFWSMVRGGNNSDSMADRLTRIAIVSLDRCKPKKWCRNARKAVQLVNCVLRLQPLRSLSSQKIYVLDAVYVSRNAHLKQFKSSISQRIWIKMQHTDMARTPSNCTGCQFLGLGKFLVWLEPNWEFHCSESFGWKAETKLWSFQ